MAAESPISGLTALGAAPATSDLLAMVDISDPTQASTGTTKRMTVANLFTAPTFTGIATASALSVLGDATIAGTLGILGVTQVECASARVVVNSLSGTASAVFFQANGTQTGAVDSPSANTVRVLDSSSSIIATFAAGALTIPAALTVSSGGAAITGNVTVTSGKLTTTASTLSLAGFNLPSGTAPTSPANGDVWFDGANVKICIGSTTHTFTIV